MTKPLPSPDKAPRGTADKLRRWAGECVPQKVMARRLGVSIPTVKRWMEEDRPSKPRASRVHPAWRRDA